MVDEIRHIAREARKVGFRAVELGRFDDEQWREFRARFGCRTATPLMLADVVDLMLRLEAGKDAEWR